MAPVETDSTQQTEGPLDSRQFARLVEGLAPPGIMATPESLAPEPAAAPQPDLAARFADLQQQLAALQARPTVAPGPSPADWSAASASGTLAAFEQLRQRRLYEEQQQRAFQPPQMPPDEALLTDPNAIKWAINAQVEHALRAYDAAVRPQMEEAQQFRQLLAPVLQQAIATADVQARSLGEQEGLDAATFDSLLPDALRMIDSAPGTSPAGRFQMRTDPGILLTAVQAARRGRGMQITPPAPPTSIGVTHSPAAAGRGREVASPGADKVEQLFGRKLFSKEQRAHIARGSALAELVNAQFPEALR